MGTRTSLVLTVVGLAILVGGAWLYLAFRGVPRITQEGDAVVVTNTGLAMRNATVDVTVGTKSYTLTLGTLPKGVTRLKLDAFDPALAGTGSSVSGASVTGTRLGGSITAYSALKLSSAGGE